MPASFKINNGILSLVNEESSSSGYTRSGVGSVNYSGKHSILFLTDEQFNELKSSGYQTKHYHTWEDWNLIPSSRPVIAEPAVRQKSIEIPGRHGQLDTSDILTGFVMYNNRSGSLNFIIDNDHVDWTTEHERLAQSLHGKRLKMILLDDLAFYYEGRFALNEWKSEAQHSTIVINYDVYPFKRTVLSSDEDWLWDPFNFEKDVIRTIKNVQVDGSLAILCPNGAETGIIPTITCSAPMTVSYNGNSYNLPAGQSNLIQLVEWDAYMTFNGTGTVTISYHGGYL